MNRYIFQTIIQIFIFSLMITMLFLVFFAQKTQEKQFIKHYESIELKLNTIDKSKLNIKEIKMLKYIDSEFTNINVVFHYDYELNKIKILENMLDIIMENNYENL